MTKEEVLAIVNSKYIRTKVCEVQHQGMDLQMRQIRQEVAEVKQENHDLMRSIDDKFTRLWLGIILTLLSAIATLGIVVIKG